MFGQSDSEGDEQEFIICPVGSLKQSFKMLINIEGEEVESIKWRILKHIEMLDDQDG